MWNPFSRTTRGSVSTAATVERGVPREITMTSDSHAGSSQEAGHSSASPPRPNSHDESAAAEASRKKRAKLAEIERVGRLAVVTILLDELTQTDGAARLADLLDQIVASGERNIVLDLQNVSFIDSSTIGCLVETLNQLTRCGGRIALVNPASNVAHLFRITRLDRIFPMCSDVLAGIQLIERAIAPE